MKRVLLLVLSLFAASTFAPAPAVAAPSPAEHPACQAPAALRAELATLDPDVSGCERGEACRAEARARLEALLDEHGFELLVAGTLHALERLDNVHDDAVLAERALARAEAHSDDIGAWYLAAATAQGEDGEPLLTEHVLAVDPDYPWAHLWLAGKAQRDDPERAAESLDRFLSQCPSQLREARTLPQRVGDAERWRKLLPMLEAATAALPEAERIATLPTLWQLQFGALPVDRHGALREQIAGQVAAVRALDRRQNPLWWDALEEGYGLVGDAAAARALQDERIAQFPCHTSSVIERVAQLVKRFDPDASDMRIKAKALDFTPEQVPDVVAALDALHAECPGDPTLVGWRFRLLDQQEEPSAERVVAVSDAYLASERARPGFRLTAPEYQVATIFVEHGVALDRVPELIETARENPADLEALRMPPPIREKMAASQQRSEVEMARLAAAAHLALGQADAARREAEQARALYLALDAEAHGERLAALHADLAPTLAGTGVEAPPAPAAEAPATDEEATTAAETWTTVEEPLGELALRDLAGRDWTLADFADQGVLINFWATWCAPCIAELPEIQALHDELEDVDGLTIVTFNTDRNIGKVVPFVEQRGFTFPVILAKDFLPPDNRSLPQNWIVDRESVVRKKSTGFSVDGEGSWRHDALEVLRSVAGGDQP